MLPAVLLGCPTTEPEPPTCGDGAIDAGELCDDGTANARTPDACRPDCTRPYCGDSITDPDAGEGCDDGEFRGGDGCSPACASEPDPGEHEPNDTPSSAEPLPGGRRVTANLLPADTDCFRFELAPGGWVSADVLGEDGAACPAPVLLRLFGPSGGVLATAGPRGDACAPLDPVRMEGARFVEGGDYVICASPLVENDVPAYVLTVTTGDDSCALADLPFAAHEDPDGDGTPSICDSDDDGDSVPDEVDTCPALPNAGASPLAPDGDGFFRASLLAGPLAGLPSDPVCLPSEEYAFDPTGSPELGDFAGNARFVADWSPSSRIDYLRTMGGPTPREAYAATYIRSDTSRTVTLALGPDDGVRAFWNGEEVITISSCQGTNLDQFTASVDVLAGWNRLFTIVRDQGGGWGLFARLLSGGEPVHDIELSLQPGATFAPDQADTDGDGVGDWCDATP